MKQSNVDRQDYMTNMFTREFMQSYVDRYYEGDEKRIIHTFINNLVDEICTCSDEMYEERQNDVAEEAMAVAEHYDFMAAQSHFELSNDDFAAMKINAGDNLDILADMAKSRHEVAKGDEFNDEDYEYNLKVIEFMRYLVKIAN